VDALDLLRAGASLVAVGTESFRDPEAGSRVARELSLLTNEVKNPAGSAQTAAFPR
jgi:dihydroorotate dehydrogenase (NAD+) catalytic subunit